MAVYKNDYSKNEDHALWMLYEIKSKMARRGLHPKTINKSAKDLIRKHRLTHLKWLRIRIKLDETLAVENRVSKSPHKISYFLPVANTLVKSTLQPR